jgi:hypothetical protein
MGLDTKTYWLTDRQSQCDIDFDFDYTVGVVCCALWEVPTEVMGKHGHSRMNENGELFIEWCAANKMVIGGILFLIKR